MNDEELSRVEAEVLRVLELESSPAPVLPGVGAVIDDFELVEEIGRGGMGVVYRARQRSVDRLVALKLVADDGDGERRKRRELEARLLGRLRHPSIVAIHGAGHHGDWYYVAMDLVAGMSLRERLRSTRDDSGESRVSMLLPPLRDVASALAAAHRERILHRDVKPGNILFDVAGAVYLADFGLARETPDRGSVTQSEGFVGTIRYAAPEQLRGERLGPTADVFSFGATAFETLCGAPPFPADDPAALQDQIQHVPPRWPRDAAVPKDLRAVIDRCLEKRPRDRYADAGEVQAELSRVLRYEPVLTVARGPIARAWRRVWLRPRRAALAAAAVTLVVIVAVLGSLVSDREASLRLATARDAFERGRYDASEPGLLDLVHRGGPHALAASSLLADQRVLVGRLDEARPLYRRVVDAGRGALADRIGAALPDESARVEGEPASARDHALLGRQASLRGDVADAAARWKNAVELEPTVFGWRVETARALRRVGHPREAIAHYEVARAIRPDEVDLLRELAEVHLKLDRFPEAESLLRGGLSLHADDAGLLAQLAWALSGRHQADESVAVAERACVVAPDDPVAWERLVIVLIEARRFDEARAAIDGPFPGGFRRRHAEGLLRLALGDANEAEGIARALVRKHPRSAAAVALLAAAVREQDRIEEAVELYARLEGLDPEEPRWPWKRGHLALDLQRGDEAEAALSRALEINPDHPEPLILKARIELLNDRPYDALLSLDRGLGLRPGDIATYYRLAKVWHRLGEPTTAITYLLLALEERPEWFEALDLAARCYGMCRYDAEADDYYTRAGALREEPASLADHAQVKHRLGDEPASLRLYRRARELDPTLLSAKGGEAILRMHAKDPAVRDVDLAIELLEDVLSHYEESPFYSAQLAEARAMRAADG